jgi:hypothetical protein
LSAKGAATLKVRMLETEMRELEVDRTWRKELVNIADDRSWDIF